MTDYFKMEKGTVERLIKRLMEYDAFKGDVL